MSHLFTAVVAVQALVSVLVLLQEPNVVECQQVATTPLSTQICTACSSIGRRRQLQHYHHQSTTDTSSSSSSASFTDTTRRVVSSSRHHQLFSKQKRVPKATTTISSSSFVLQWHEQEQHEQQQERHLVQTTTVSTSKYTNVTITNYGPDITNTSYLDGSAECVDNCTPGVEFCGTDGNCHSNSCENFYYYGSSFYTGVPSTSTTSNQSTTTTSDVSITDIPPINCTTIDVFTQSIDETYPVGIVYGCAATDENNTKEPKPICLPQNISTTSYSVYYTQKCVANPAPYHTFTCYDMKPNTNFTNYKLQTLPSNNEGGGGSSTVGYQCSSSSSSTTASTKSSILPQHMYGIDLVRVDMTPSSSYGCSKVATIMQASNLIEDLAYSTLSSVLSIENPNNNNNNDNSNDNNTNSGPSPTPVTSSSSSYPVSRSIMSYITMIIAIVGFVV